MRLRRRNWRRIHRLQRFELPDAHPRPRGQTRPQAQDHSPRRGADEQMSSPPQQFKEQAEVLTHDLRHRDIIQAAMRKYEVVRDKSRGAFQDYRAARQAAAETKWEAINHLDKYLEQLTQNLEARGTKVHWATTGEQARDIILGIIREKKARSIVK